MAEKPAAEKTEQPTPKRLQKARNEGQVPQSQELNAAAALVVLLFALVLLGPHLLRWFRLKVEDGLSAQPGALTDPQAFLHFVNGRLVDVLLVMFPILGVLAVTGLLSSLAISGSNLTATGLKIKWNRINPATGIQNLCSTRSVVRLLTSVAKLLFVTMIVWFYLRGKLEDLAALRWAWSVQIMGAIARIIFGLGLRVGVAVLIIGAADAYYQKWKYIQDLKMTRQEVKEERKDTDGSPEIKSKIRRIQIQLSMKRLMQEVPKANVILVNPTHVAVALRYDARTMEAPVLVAKGADLLAERIRQIGRSHGIPIVRRPEIARTIYADVKPGQPIPESLYVAVAEVLAMIYRLRKRRQMSSG